MGLQELIDRLQEMQAELGPGNDDRKVLVDDPQDKSSCFPEVVDVQFRHGFQLVLVTN